MMSRARLVSCGSALAFVAAALPAAAATNVSVVPPASARFLAGQKFDIRVEGQGTGPFSATLAIDGHPKTFTSGAQGTTTTDGISSPGWGGFNLRGYSSGAPGHHTITATFTDASGPVSVSGGFDIVAVGGGDKKVKNIIIMLGDGMGVAHRTAARLVKYGVTAGNPNGFLAMDRFPGTGLVTTHSLNGIITDSAPGMACYSSGNHANNGQEGVYPAHIVEPFFYPRVEYLSEYLHRVRGTSLGLVSTADLEDATPAANAVHTGDRNRGTGVVDEYLDEADPVHTRFFGTGLDVLLGGGRRWFVPATPENPLSSRTAASDYGPLPADLASRWNLPIPAAQDPARDLIGGFKAAGFKYVETASDLSSAVSGRAPHKLLGLFAWGNMNVALDKLAKRRNAVVSPEYPFFVVDDYLAPDQPMLEDMTAAALKVLRKNQDGFVLMVEGAHIDKQSHLMDADRAIDETIEFDNAIAVARRFAEDEPRTLVIVLADHECSGFSLIGALTGPTGNAGSLSNLKGLASDASLLDPLSAPKRQGVVGVYEASGFPHYAINPTDGYPETFDIDGKVLVGYGASADRFEGWLTKPRPIIDSLLPTPLKASLGGLGYGANPVDREENQEGFFLRGQAAGRTQAVHTASDIPISAFSRNDAFLQFVGVQKNIDVFFKLAKLALGSPGWDGHDHD